MEILGIDVGFGFTKATNGNDVIIFKSIFGDATDMQFRLSIGSASFAENLHVTIENQPYFIGDFAEQQSNVRQFTLYQERLLTEFAKILSLTAAGSVTDKYVPLNVVTGLPIGYFKLAGPGVQNRQDTYLCTDKTFLGGQITYALGGRLHEQTIERLLMA